MAEEYEILTGSRPDIAIKKCAAGFLVCGSQYGGEELRAFSTAEGLIEWLSRELGAGPIVWAWTIPIWADIAGVKEEDLLPMPDVNVDPTGYRESQEYNAAFLISRFAEEIIKAKSPPPLPEPKPKKEKKGKKAYDSEAYPTMEALESEGLLPEEEKPKTIQPVSRGEAWVRSVLEEEKLKEEVKEE